LNNNETDFRWIRFFDRQGLIWPEELCLEPSYKVAVMCYLEKDGQVLLLRRNRPPFVGCWTAPSGKIEKDEDPCQALKREVFEETHLNILSPKFRMILWEHGPNQHYQWLLFIFSARKFTGELQESPEGVLRWFALEELPDCGMPGIDVIVSDYVFRDTPPFFGTVHFDREGKTEKYSFRFLQSRQE
jgi:8-oxo-dGTP diphosphatase